MEMSFMPCSGQAHICVPTNRAETESFHQKDLGRKVEVVKWKEVMSTLEGGLRSNSLF